jgi:hypothetical protein
MELVDAWEAIAAKAGGKGLDIESFVFGVLVPTVPDYTRKFTNVPMKASSKVLRRECFF